MPVYRLYIVFPSFSVSSPARFKKMLLVLIVAMYIQGKMSLSNKNIKGGNFLLGFLTS